MRYVKYVGLAHQRQITAQDWRGVGITADTVVWSAYNGFAVPLDQFSDSQIRKAIDPDTNLVITGEDEEFEPVSQNMQMTPAQASQAVEAPVDVVAMANGDDRASQSGSGATPGGGGAAPTTTGTTKGAGSDSPGTTAH